MKTQADDDIQANIITLATGLYEVIGDQLLEDGIFKDIPVVGSIANLLSAARGFKDQLFEKKLRKFLEQLAETTPEQRRSELDAIESDDEYEIKVGEKLLYIIDQSDDHEASSIIGKLFAAYIKSEIIYDDFLRASAIVNSLFSQDLERFLSLEPADINYTTRIEDVGVLAFSSLYEVKVSKSFEGGVFVLETSIAGHMRSVLGRKSRQLHIS